MIDPINPEPPISVPKGATEPELTVGAATSSTTLAPAPSSPPAAMTEPSPKSGTAMPVSAPPAPAPVSQPAGSAAPEATAEAPTIDAYKNMSAEAKDAHYQKVMKDPWAYCFGNKRKAPPPTPKPKPPAPQPEPLPAAQLLSSIGSTIREWTDAPKEMCFVLACWILSTYFRDVLPLLPALVISGPAHQAIQLLRALKLVCHLSVLLPEFRRSDIERCHDAWTVLLTAPDLRARTAAILGYMASCDFTSWDQYSTGFGRSIAVWVGEHSPGLIPDSISITLQPTDTMLAPPLRPSHQIEALKRQIHRYREAHRDEVWQRSFQPAGLSPETAEIARSLCNCIVDAPEAQKELVKLLRTEDNNRLVHRSATDDSVIVEAVRNLARNEHPGYLYARGIAAECNRLLECRGEKARFTPEKLGHRLPKLGLPTRRLNQAGNGLALDATTLARIDELAAINVMEDCLKTMEVATDQQVPTDQAIKKVM